MSDAIDALVDWQLAQRRAVDVVVDVCRVCLTQWTGRATTCPECGIEQ